MSQKRLREMGLGELMGMLADCQPGSIARPQYEAEFERRKYLLTLRGISIAALGVLLAAAHYCGLTELIRNAIVR